MLNNIIVFQKKKTSENMFIFFIFHLQKFWELKKDEIYS